ncbi:hypothetical protein Cni_G09955 [Canna indica]|uniref:Uncharacterized protein n=1 Tax=Canna indica TaxID=4628 RepID=A0AAQ3K3C1_9LILI|nr:hypothetical protein Cni_G09955 [Canna indica]
MTKTTIGDFRTETVVKDRSSHTIPFVLPTVWLARNGRNETALPSMTLRNLSRGKNELHVWCLSIVQFPITFQTAVEGFFDLEPSRLDLKKGMEPENRACDH